MAATVEWGDQEAVITEWCSIFKQGTDFDTWGQPLEATDVYQR